MLVSKFEILALFFAKRILSYSRHDSIQVLPPQQPQRHQTTADRIRTFQAKRLQAQKRSQLIFVLACVFLFYAYTLIAIIQVVVINFMEFEGTLKEDLILLDADTGERINPPGYLRECRYFIPHDLPHVLVLTESCLLYWKSNWGTTFK